MPSYFYHLNFELYPYPSSASAAQHKEREIWVPPQGSDIFENGEWPAHKPVEFDQQPRRRDNYKSKHEQEFWERKGGGVIDCGPARASNHSSSGSEEAEPKPDKELEVPPPIQVAAVHRDLETAERDWRLGRVRVESLDFEMEMERPRRERGESSSTVPQRPGPERGESNSTIQQQRPALSRGESSSAVQQQDGINAGLTAGGIGRVTKARYESFAGKNTEVGWGVVHLYRDGEETPGLGMGVEVYTAGEEEGGEDCTTLCIPAVPGYFTPSDFLGFVGEKTREMVSHFRMVMTGRMNRYLVLMKFRDSGEARRWRADFDGKVFNSMEVSHSLLRTATVTLEDMLTVL
jgi:BRCA1-associated protein